MSARRIRPSECTHKLNQRTFERPTCTGHSITAGQVRRIGDLKARIVEALDNSGYAALSAVGCDVDSNRVILRGSVPSYHLKQLAQVHALRVDGIGRLENRLEVRGRGPC